MHLFLPSFIQPFLFDYSFSHRFVCSFIPSFISFILRPLESYANIKPHPFRLTPLRTQVAPQIIIGGAFDLNVLETSVKDKILVVNCQHKEFLGFSSLSFTLLFIITHRCVSTVYWQLFFARDVALHHLSVGEEFMEEAHAQEVRCICMNPNHYSTA